MPDSEQRRSGHAPGDFAGLDAAETECVLQGLVERVTYRAKDSHYTVLRLSPERGYGDPQGMFALERVTAVGATPSELDGQRVRLVGHWMLHPQHGRQFRFTTAESLPPLDRAGLERYLASSAFRGVGPKLAARIVDELGPHALTRIREDPDALDGVPGIPRATRVALAAAVRKELGAQEQRAFLLGLGLGTGQVEAVERRFGLEAERKVQADPYVLAREIRGIGFPTADQAAEHLGLDPMDPVRRRAALLFALERGATDGHTLLPKERLLQAAEELLGGSDAAPLLEDLAELAREGELVVEEERVYLARFHTCETALVRNLEALVASGPVPALADEARLEAAEGEADLRLWPEQRAAVLQLLREPVALLSGGPGVGKTTIVRLVAELAEKASRHVLLASPTGRAAKRLAEATGRPASTIHRMLGWEPGREGRGRFAHDARRPLEADLVVVDEISMLDLVLAHHLLKAVQPPTRLILVGDPDQLPSVAAGNVLSDLLACGELPVSRLKEIHRQRRESGIVANAHRILAGEEPVYPKKDETSGDFFFFREENEHDAAERLIEVVTERIPARFGLVWERDVQVLAPMYRGACGVDALNVRLREALGSGGREVHWHGSVWRVGDRVVHTRNDYEKEVFNGDMGWIASIGADGEELCVRFPERTVRYTRSEFSDLKPAFAMTVHRSQGGEFPCVVMPLVTQHFAMLQRHLLYTAVTRAQRLVVLVGSPRALRLAIGNAEQSHRASGLADRLRATLEERCSPPRNGG